MREVQRFLFGRFLRSGAGPAPVYRVQFVSLERLLKLEIPLNKLSGGLDGCAVLRRHCGQVIALVSSPRRATWLKVCLQLSHLYSIVGIWLRSYRSGRRMSTKLCTLARFIGLSGSRVPMVDSSAVPKIDKCFQRLSPCRVLDTVAGMVVAIFSTTFAFLQEDLSLNFLHHLVHCGDA